MKRIIAAALCVLMLAGLLCGCGSKGAETQNPVATIKLAGGDIIKIELYPDAAPNTVNNFIYLINEGFYDGLTFHRVVKDMLVQAGDPDNNCNGGPGYTIAGDFLKYGYDKTLSHTVGTVSMARRSSGYDTAGSQFFILTADVTELDGFYAAFGKVIEGMDVVNAISQLDTDENGKPLDTIKIKKMTVDTFGADFPQPEVIKDK